jgi:hypothetical protein
VTKPIISPRELDSLLDRRRYEAERLLPLAKQLKQKSWAPEITP